jgi:hypothetical protein
MRKSFSVLVLVVCGFWSASQAMAQSICDGIAGNLVVNCGFESGTFSGWNFTGITDDPVVGGIPTYYGVDTIDANSGNFGAYMSQDYPDDGAGTVNLSQTLATTVGAMYDITYYLEDDYPPGPTTGYTETFSSTFGGTTMQTLAPTVTSPGLLGTFTEYSFAETATSPSTNLQFDFENDANYWSFDDVSVVAAATPEPSTGLLGGLALGALLLFMARRRGSVDVQSDGL